MARSDDFTDILALPLDDGLVLSRGQGRLFLLNFTGRLIWQGLAAGRSPREVAAGLAADFQIPPETAERDVSAALGQWLAEGLLTSNRPSIQLVRPPVPEPVRPSGVPGRVRVYRLLGRTIRMRFDTEDLEAEFDPLLAHARIGDQTVPDLMLDLHQTESGPVLVVDDRMIAVDDRPGEFKAAVLTEVLSALHPGREWIALLHAAVVGVGRTPRECLVLSAGAGSGKSTLAAALARSGFTFMSDDTTALDRAEVKVAALPLGLSIKPGGRALLAGLYPEIQDLPVRDRSGFEVSYLPPPSPDGPGPHLLPARALLFPGYDPGAGSEIRELSGLEALARLVRSGAWISSAPEDVTRVVDWIGRTPAFEIIYDSLDEALALVRRVVES
jgi:hypothetical protein